MPVNAPTVSEAALLLVDDGEHTSGVDAGLQIISRQRRIEIVERLDLTSAGAEGEVGGRRGAVLVAAIFSLAAQRGRSAAARGGRGREAESRQGAGGAADREIARRAGMQGQSRRRSTVDVRRRGAGDRVDRVEHVTDRSGGQVDGSRPWRAGATGGGVGGKVMVLPLTVA